MDKLCHVKQQTDENKNSGGGGGGAVGEIEEDTRPALLGSIEFECTQVTVPHFTWIARCVLGTSALVEMHGEKKGKLLVSSYRMGDLRK